MRGSAASPRRPRLTWYKLILYFSPILVVLAVAQIPPAAAQIPPPGFTGWRLTHHYWMTCRQTGQPFHTGTLFGGDPWPLCYRDNQGYGPYQLLPPEATQPGSIITPPPTGQFFAPVTASGQVYRSHDLGRAALAPFFSSADGGTFPSCTRGYLTDAAGMGLSFNFAGLTTTGGVLAGQFRCNVDSAGAPAFRVYTGTPPGNFYTSNGAPFLLTDSSDETYFTAAAFQVSSANFAYASQVFNIVSMLAAYNGGAGWCGRTRPGRDFENGYYFEPCRVLCNAPTGSAVGVGGPGFDDNFRGIDPAASMCASLQSPPPAPPVENPGNIVFGGPAPDPLPNPEPDTADPPDLPEADDIDPPQDEPAFSAAPASPALAASMYNYCVGVLSAQLGPLEAAVFPDAPASGLNAAFVRSKRAIANNAIQSRSFRNFTLDSLGQFDFWYAYTSCEQWEQFLYSGWGNRADNDPGSFGSPRLAALLQQSINSLTALTPERFSDIFFNEDGIIQSLSQNLADALPNAPAIRDAVSAALAAQQEGNAQQIAFEIRQRLGQNLTGSDVAGALAPLFEIVADASRNPAYSGPSAAAIASALSAAIPGAQAAPTASEIGEAVAQSLADVLPEPAAASTLTAADIGAAVRREILPPGETISDSLHNSLQEILEDYVGLNDEYQLPDLFREFVPNAAAIGSAVAASALPPTSADAIASALADVLPEPAAVSTLTAADIGAAVRREILPPGETISDSLHNSLQEILEDYVGLNDEYQLPDLFREFVPNAAAIGSAVAASALPPTSADAIASALADVLPEPAAASTLTAADIAAALPTAADIGEAVADNVWPVDSFNNPINSAPSIVNLARGVRDGLNASSFFRQDLANRIADVLPNAIQIRGGDPSLADEIGAAVGEALAGAPSQPPSYAGPSADDIGEAVGREVPSAAEIGQEVADHLPPAPELPDTSTLSASQEDIDASGLERVVGGLVGFRVTDLASAYLSTLQQPGCVDPVLGTFLGQTFRLVGFCNLANIVRPVVVALTPFIAVIAFMRWSRGAGYAALAIAFSVLAAAALSRRIFLPFLGQFMSPILSVFPATPSALIFHLGIADLIVCIVIAAVLGYFARLSLLRV